MTPRLAIIAGSGRLPDLLAEAEPTARIVRFADARKGEIAASFERLGGMFRRLSDDGITHCVMAGGMKRPKLDPTKFDEMSKVVLPDIAEAMAGGDDALLRKFIQLFEDQGIKVAGAHQVRPDLLVQPGILTGSEPTPRMLIDAALGTLVLATLAPLDLTQSTVTSGNRVLAIETAFGTADMLKSLAGRGQGGVLSKRAKANQDLRVDMPAIGPKTIEQAAKAQLSAIALEARKVLIIDRDETLKRATEAKITIFAT
ncbi:MAG: UDP-2,3-diacylglucosamine diphosphatase LpxI [Deltaproteobacteria bacterium]